MSDTNTPLAAPARHPLDQFRGELDACHFMIRGMKHLDGRAVEFTLDDVRKWRDRALLLASNFNLPRPRINLSDITRPGDADEALISLIEWAEENLKDRFEANQHAEKATSCAQVQAPTESQAPTHTATSDSLPSMPPAECDLTCLPPEHQPEPSPDTQATVTSDAVCADDWEVWACGLLQTEIGRIKKLKDLYRILKEQGYPHSFQAIYKYHHLLASAEAAGVYHPKQAKSGRVLRGHKTSDGQVEAYSMDDED